MPHEQGEATTAPWPTHPGWWRVSGTDDVVRAINEISGIMVIRLYVRLRGQPLTACYLAEEVRDFQEAMGVRDLSFSLLHPTEE